MHIAFTDSFIERRYRLNGPDAAKAAEEFNAAYDRGYMEQRTIGLYRNREKLYARAKEFLAPKRGGR